jgi:hypothetical protein
MSERERLAARVDLLERSLAWLPPASRHRKAVEAALGRARAELARLS